MRHARATALLGLLLAACSDGAAPPAGAPAAVQAASQPAPAVERAARSQAPAVIALRRALEFGDVDAARAAIAAADQAGPEGELLRARLAMLEGRAVDAMRLVEAAKRARPRDPDAWATSAEVYAAREAFDTAWSEIQQGEAACGAAPEILRAKGICWISKQGGVARGLEHLAAARAADPTLPFCDRALGQAHLLAAKQHAKDEELPAALSEVRRALESDPQDVDARRFLADVLAGLGDFDAAIAEITALVRGGEPLQAEVALLHKRAGFAALLRQDRAAAIAHFAAARQGGLSDAELSTAASILSEEANARVEAGVRAFTGGDLQAAETAFRAALELDPRDIAAQNHLAVVRFQRGDPAEAARLWERVLEAARAERIELPEPVHVNLAQAYLRTGEPDKARLVLERYLADEPEGDWVGATRALLAQLEAGGR